MKARIFSRLLLPLSPLSSLSPPISPSTPSPKPLVNARDLLEELRNHQPSPPPRSAQSPPTAHPLRGPFLGRLELVKQVTQNGLQNILNLREPPEYCFDPSNYDPLNVVIDPSDYDLSLCFWTLFIAPESLVDPSNIFLTNPVYNLLGYNFFYTSIILCRNIKPNAPSPLSLSLL